MLTDHQLVIAVLDQSEYWQTEEFEADTRSSFVHLRKNFVLDKSRSATIIFLPSPFTAFLAADAHRFNTPVSKKLEDNPYCYVPESADDFISIHCLGSNGPRSS